MYYPGAVRLADAWDDGSADDTRRQAETLNLNWAKRRIILSAKPTGSEGCGNLFSRPSEFYPQSNRRTDFAPSEKGIEASSFL